LVSSNISFNLITLINIVFIFHFTFFLYFSKSTFFRPLLEDYKFKYLKG
jgi:hypothetical protein